MIADCGKALTDIADVFHSTVAAWQDGLRKNVWPDWPVIRGEMRHHRTHGSTSSELIGAGSSSRIPIKQDNFRTERALTYYAEPLAVFAGLLGAPYPVELIDHAYNWMLQNHGHDSIGACGRDIISEDFPFRSRQTREISTCVMERAMLDITGSIDLSEWSPREMALVVYNPAPFKRSETVPLVVHAPREWKCDTIEIADQQGHPVPFQICDKTEPAYKTVYSPNDCANTFELTRFAIRAALTDIPSLGYVTYRIKPVILPKPKSFTQPATMLTGPQTMENEHLAVTINPNGTLTLRDKASGRVYEGLGYFRDSGEDRKSMDSRGTAKRRVIHHAQRERRGHIGARWRAGNLLPGCHQLGLAHWCQCRQEVAQLATPDVPDRQHDHAPQGPAVGGHRHGG